MDQLRQALDRVHTALAVAEPNSELQKQLTAVQLSLLEVIWLGTVHPEAVTGEAMQNSKFKLQN